MPNFEERKVRNHIDEKDTLLGIVESEIDIPFVPTRFFYVNGSSNNYARGNHAHKTCWQAIFVIQGSVEITIIESKQKITNHLILQPNNLVIIPPLHWISYRLLQKFTIIGVLASENYEESEYIKDYKEFLKY